MFATDRLPSGHPNTKSWMGRDMIRPEPVWFTRLSYLFLRDLQSHQNPTIPYIKMLKIDFSGFPKWQVRLLHEAS